MKDVYRHYKGGLYRVLFSAMDEETEEHKIVYVSLKDGRIWLRDPTVFYGEVFVGDKYVRRFEPYDDPSRI